ncbi:MAG: diguanylate cyclase [Mariprofundaceae bacterium]
MPYREKIIVRERQLDLLANASAQIHQNLEVSDILRAVVSAATNIVRAESGAAGLLVDGKMGFSECYVKGRWTPMQYRFEQDQGVVGHLMKTGRPYMTDDISSGPQLLPEMNNIVGGVQQLVAIPLYGKQDGLIGCVFVFNHADGQFSDQDQDMLARLASNASIAIDNALLLSQSRQVEEDLQKSVATYRTLVEQIPAVTYIATLDKGRMRFVSPQVENMLGRSEHDFLSRADAWHEQIHEQDKDRVLDEVRQSYMSGEAFQSEYRIVMENGETRWLQDAAAVVRENDKALYLQGVMSDITERKQTEEKLTQMAHFDHLTKLANRALFLDRLDQAIVQSKRGKQQFSVLFIDLDGFKAVNDTLGHQAGDEVLMEAAKRLSASVREADTVARMGGDEFTIILREVHHQQDVEQVAKKVVKAIAAPFKLGGVITSESISASVGVAMFPQDAEQRDALITAADNAMYQAKNSGKNCFKLNSSFND